MGGCCCCCASKTAEVNNSSPFYQNPRALEESEPLSSRQAAVSAFSTGLLVDTNLDTSVPDTYQPPPAPIPYEALVGRPPTQARNQEGNGQKGVVVGQTTPTTESIDDANLVDALRTKPRNLESDEKTQINNELEATKEVEYKKSDTHKMSREEVVSPLEDEEDVCPTCLEEYDSENPRIITKCDHPFHLACILEWMERSDTCPVCDQIMVFSPVIGG